MKNLGYLECHREGYHSGEFLNIVCLNPACKNDVLCCCACVQQLHPNHKTKTLKKLLLDADTLAKNQKQQPKPLAKQQKKCLNTDIMANMVQNEEKNIICKLQQLKSNFIKQIDDLETNIHTYFKSLYQQLSKPAQSGHKDSKMQVLETIQLVQGSATIESLKTNVLRLLKGVESLQKSSNIGSLEGETPDEQSYLNFLKNSNIDIQNIVEVRIKDLYGKLVKQASKMKSINNKISSFWSNKLYKFSPLMHHDNMELLNPFTVRANVDSVYQMALMNPALTFANDVETFTFRINANDLEWVGIGVCYKNIAEKSNYQFNFNGLGHGCYMISGNAGAWSHSDGEFNNVVKAFTFKPGDYITCTVSKTKISFFKNVPPEFEETLQFSQKEYYELQIKSEPNDTLHPCVVCFYQNTEVEYLPSFKNLQLQLPNYDFKFNEKTRHKDLIIINGNHLIGCAPTTYKSCILDCPIQKSSSNDQSKPVTFRIVKSTGSWIGLGVCHKNVVVNKNYDFYFEDIGHGCYMVSANGGSWSNLDVNENNIVKTFKFVDGDLITVSLDQKNNKVLFKKGIERYELKYVPMPGDKLYPIVVLYYPDDEVDVLPNF